MGYGILTVGVAEKYRESIRILRLSFAYPSVILYAGLDADTGKRGRRYEEDRRRIQSGLGLGAR